MLLALLANGLAGRQLLYEIRDGWTAQSEIERLPTQSGSSFILVPMELDDRRERGQQSERILVDLLILAVGLPLFLLALGASIGWAIAGFAGRNS